MQASRALELAVDAAAFIESNRRGVFWARTPEPDSAVDHTLYHGTAGIIVFLLELSDATGDPSYAERAVEAGRALVDVVDSKSWASVAFATGWTGYAFALNELALRTDDPAFAAASERCVRRLIAQATPIGRGIGWIEPMPFADITGFSGDREIYDLSVGAAGSGVAMLSLAAALSGTGRAEYVERAGAIGERLLEVGEPTPDGTRWGLMSDIPFPFTAPNFAHGGAGVGYFFARLFEATGDRRFLDAASDAARYVVSRMHPVGEGALVCHTEELQPPEFYLGQCHGPAGTGRLFTLLARLTLDSALLTPLDTMMRGLDGIGAPSTRSWGWWNNYGRCCGDAGLGDAALLFAGSPCSDGRRAGYLSLARACATVVDEQSVSANGARSWTQAEHRARPRFVQAQTGYMQGAAGIGSFLVHLATHDRAGGPARVALPDDVV